MLKSLTIKNYALIDSLHAEFGNGLVILTGETGAGKSIIVDALGLIIGERASPEVVRSGMDKAVVEGVFSLSGARSVKELLYARGVECREELIVRREVSAKGQSRAFVDDSPVTLGLLKQVGELLVDLHGQHDHQSLLRPETHVRMLDEVGGLDGMVQEFRGSLEHMGQVSAELEELRLREQQLREKREFYAFQLQEIDAVGPRPGEEEELESELRVLENAERLFSATATLYELLYEGDRSVRDQLVVARNQLQDLAEIDARFDDAAQECGSADAIISELARFIQSYNAGVEFNPQKLEQTRERLGRLSLMKKKYGGTIDLVLKKRSEISQELSLADNFGGVLDRLERELEVVRKECGTLAERLSAKRHEVAQRVDGTVVKELKKVGIREGGFSTRISQSEFTASKRHDGLVDLYVTSGQKKLWLNERGYDTVEFHISTNRGEEEKPLVKVASGGEVSRVMLALKTVLAKSDRLPVLVFDEIDVGVSGRIAQEVGMSLKSLSQYHQVVVITHLPQIAGLADAHYKVFKKERKGRTVTLLRKLSLTEQVEEVAKLMSGSQVTEAGLSGARELMGLH
jgi:DNA repair protein RecN (Recombination protein N)